MYERILATVYISHLTESDWGKSILIMRKDGLAFARIYWFNDDNTTVYLDWLSVYETIRNCGVGTDLQEIREKIGKSMGAKYSCLWVKKDTWMREWYEKRGYEYWKEYKNEENAIWMQKAI